MMNKLEFYELVASAYRSLYDFVALRNHPLSDYLLAGQEIEAKERGWRVHNLLLKLLEELHPQGAPALSKEWRRHRLLVLRYVETMQTNLIAEQLAISRRQFYREHNSALESLGDILWQRLCLEDSKANAPELDTALMQRELSRMSQFDSQADFAQVLSMTLVTLEKVLAEKNILIELNLLQETTILLIGQNILRQALMSALGIFLESNAAKILSLEMKIVNARLLLEIKIEPVNAIALTTIQTALDSLASILNFANGDMDILLETNDKFYGLILDFPLEETYSILVADDNEDTLALYQRFLSHQHYHVITTSDADSVLPLAMKIIPDFIILDLMMPKRDGWDLLQALSNQAETAMIPIMICSVLKQRQLALSLGADSFLEKPFTEQSLLAALDELRRVSDAEF